MLSQRWRYTVAAAMTLSAGGLVLWMYPGSLTGLWRWLMVTQNGAIVIGLLSGTLGSLVATLLYSKVEKEAWKGDVALLRTEVAAMRSTVAEEAALLEQVRTIADAIKTDLTVQLTASRRDHELLLKSFVPAIGGAFTKSLFAFHPMASAQIAGILSAETDRLYGRHHKRVIVTKAKDTYAIRGLKRLVDGSTPVWFIEFHVMWEWLNDSKVTKYPLDDFLLVAAANEEALSDFSYQSEADKLIQRERLGEFFKDRQNIVRSTIVNPWDVTKRIPADLMSQVFTIDRLDISYDGSTHLIKPSDLRQIPDSDLPVGVYSAFSFPQLNRSLPVGAKLGVEYVGHICLRAEATEDGQFGGFMSFPPSDVIGNQYDLTLLYPREVGFEGSNLQLDVVSDQSGCKFIHGPLLNSPSPRIQTRNDVPKGLTYKGGLVAQIRVTGPLTDLHELSLTWKGETRNPASEIRAAADQDKVTLEPTR